MINQVDITENFESDNLFLIKIKSNALCYSSFDFCKTFKQVIDDKTTAYIGVLNFSATCFIHDGADIDEIKSFLKFYGIKNVFSNIDFFHLNKGIILKFDTNQKIKKQYESTSFADYKPIYNLLKSEFCVPCYDEFVSDLSYRIKYGFARLVRADCGVTFTLWECESDAVISAVAVDITKRGTGLGSALLQSIVFDLKKDSKQNIYVYCEQKNKDFYLKNGFLPTGEYFTGELQ